MRTRIAAHLIALIVASLAGLILVTPAQALALVAAPRSSVASPIAGETFVLSGSLGRSVRRVVALEYYSAGKWRTKQRKTYPAAGRYQFSVTQAATTTSWRVRAVKVRKGGRTYQVRQTRPLKLTKIYQDAVASVADSTILGRTVPVSARFRPARPGRAVALQYLNGSAWVTVANGYESSVGTATFSYTPPAVGRQYLRAVALASRGAATYEGPADLLTTLPTEPVQVSAHRGDSARYPENTLPAFQAAIALGVDWMEMDVRRTLDGKWVLMHDETLKRTTNIESSPTLAASQNAKVETFTLEQLRTLDAGSWKGSQFTGTQIPTLDEVLEAVRASGTPARLSIEVKAVTTEADAAANTEKDKQNIVALADHIKETPALSGWIVAGNTDKVVITSFSEPAVKHLEEKRGDDAVLVIDGEKPIGADVGLIFDPRTNPTTPTDFTPYKWARQVGISESRIAGPLVAERVHAAGLDLVGWTPNSTEDLLRLAVNGVDVVTTDDPVRALALLRP